MVIDRLSNLIKVGNLCMKEGNYFQREIIFLKKIDTMIGLNIGDFYFKF